MVRSDDEARIMPFFYRIDPVLGMVWVAGEGLVTDEDLIRLSHQVSSDPLFGPQMRLLCDWSEVTQSKVTQVGIAYEVAHCRFSVASRRAYVVRGGSGVPGRRLSCGLCKPRRGAQHPHISVEGRRAFLAQRGRRPIPEVPL